METKTKRSIWHRFGKPAVRVVSVILLLCGVSALALRWRFMARIPKAQFLHARDRTEANREDLEYFRKVFPAADRSFSPEFRSRFDGYVDALTARAGELSRGELAMGVARAAALSNNGHTGLSSQRLPHIPVRFYWFSDGLYVLQASPAHANLLGFRVEKIGGHSPEEALNKLRECLPGVEAHKRYRSTHFMDSPEALEGLGLNPSADSIVLELKSPEGKEISQTLDVESSTTTPEHEIDPRFKNGPGCDVTCNWPHILDGVSSPLYAERAHEGYFRRWLEEEKTLYVRIFTIGDAGTQPISRFLAETLAEAAERKPLNVVVDLRGNGGGDYFKTRRFTRQIVARVPGEVFIIADEGTFSAALVTAAFLKNYGGVRAHIVGEHAGDAEQFWSEGGGPIILPNSNLDVWVATGYHDWEHGCSDWAKCFWPDIFFGVAAGKLDADLPANSTFAAYRSGRDESMERIVSFLHREK